MVSTAALSGGNISGKQAHFPQKKTPSPCLARAGAFFRETSSLNVRPISLGLLDVEVVAAVLSP
ncbi:MAG: hypothetical protein AB1921_18880, partial [Thermodesulfobacteriota bacterium]